MRFRGPRFLGAAHLLVGLSLTGCNLFTEQQHSFDHTLATTDAGQDSSPPIPDAAATRDATSGDLANADALDMPDLLSSDATVADDLSGSDSDASVDVDADPGPDGCAAALALRPIIYWPLDQLDALLQYPNLGTAESAGSLTPFGVPMSVPGVHGHALAFDGVDDALLFDHSTPWKLSDGSLSFWIRAAALPSSADEWAVMVSKDALGYGQGGHVTVTANGAGAVVLRIQDATKSYHASSADDVVAIDKWQHVVAIFGAQGMRLHVNGALLATDSYAGGLYGNNGSLYNAEPGAIGAGTDLSNQGQHTPMGSWLKGAIDEVLVFDRALTVVEVVELYSACSINP